MVIIKLDTMYDGDVYQITNNIP